MNCIQRLTLHNFKSHQDTVFHFVEGLNCLIGSGNVGKSTVLSAIEWVTKNDVAKDFITWGCHKASVSILYASGDEVIRSRDGKTNLYKIVYADGRQEDFEGFGTSVPKKVQDVIGLTSLSIDVDKQVDLNVIRQHDGPFLLGKEWGGSGRNKTINAIIGMQYIDSAIRSIAPEIKSFDSQRQKMEDEMKSLMVSIEDLGDLNDLQDKITVLKELCEQYDGIEQSLEEIDYLLQSMNDINQKIEYVKLQIGQSPSINDVQDFDNTVRSYTDICHLVDTADDFYYRYYDFNNRYEAYQGVDVEFIKEFLLLLPEYQTCCRVVEHHKDNQDKLDDLIYRIDFTKTTKQMAYSDLMKTIIGLHTCPFCDSNIDEDKAKVIMERI